MPCLQKASVRRQRYDIAATPWPINAFSPVYIKVPMLCDMLIVIMMSELASPGQYHPLQVLPVEKLVSSFFIYSIII
jgi:hypothetical protein